MGHSGLDVDVFASYYRVKSGEKTFVFLYPRCFNGTKSRFKSSRGLTVKEFNNGTQSVPFELFNGLNMILN